MRKTLLLLGFCLLFVRAFAQLEVGAGYAWNQRTSGSLPVRISYAIHLHGHWSTKTQLGYRQLHRAMTFAGATATATSLEFHQTISLEMIREGRYSLCPNLGFNYKIYDWTSEGQAPASTTVRQPLSAGAGGAGTSASASPARWRTNFRQRHIGISMQLQNRYRFSNRVALHLTPFVEPSGKKGLGTAGCFAGLLLNR